MKGLLIAYNIIYPQLISQTRPIGWLYAISIKLKNNIMKNNLPDFCVSSKADGFNEFLMLYNKHFSTNYVGNLAFYGYLETESYCGKKWSFANEITPLQAIALLNSGEEPTQQESVKREDENKSIHRILIDFGCPPIPFDENVTMYYPAIVSAMQEYSNQQNAHLPQQLDEAKEKIAKLEGIKKVKHKCIVCGHLNCICKKPLI